MSTYTKIDGPGKAILEKALKDIDKLGVAIGWLGSSKYPDDGPSVAEVAAVNEFGDPSRGIPPRPFMRPAMETNKNKLSKIAQEKIDELLQGKLQNAEQVVEAIAADVAGAIKRAITNVTTPALKEKTVEARLARMAKSSQRKGITTTLRKPLVDTKYMLNSITSFTFKDGGGT